MFWGWGGREEGRGEGVGAVYFCSLHSKTQQTISYSQTLWFSLIGCIVFMQTLTNYVDGKLELDAG